MTITVLLFGELAELANTIKLSINDITDTELLIDTLNHSYPQFKNKTYLISVNQHIIKNKTILNNEDEVALLPPFSGG